MTKEEQATLDEVSNKLDRLIDVMGQVVQSQASDAAPTDATSEGQLSLLEELQIDEIVNLRLRNKIRTGFPVGNMENLMADERRRYIQELTERGGIIVVRPSAAQSLR